MLLIKFHKNLVSSFGEDFKVFFKVFLSVAMTTRKMMKSKFRSELYAPNFTQMLLITFHKNLVSSFGGEDF